MDTYKLNLEKIDHLYENFLPGVVAIVIIILMVLYAFNGQVSETNLNIWVYTNLFVVGVRVIVLISYKKTKITEKNHLKYY